ncbi:YraN family protein [Saccharibacillus sp. O23]|uniref:YraN family protein n=1 Tax=Saccharibacillus sp. O23 TaxID=2009338 RepID=UPI000B4E1DFF|nr:YraN family protein [Saccharibacillus sp. O23]OWR27832.1 YraN family protein [Saccharibacillus sp. O23]
MSDNERKTKEAPASAGAASLHRGPARTAYTRKEKGKAAEDAAALHLERNGWTVKERNWSCRTGELDLIAVRGETILFVEVRSRSGSGFGLPAESVDARKIRKVRHTAEAYLHRFGLSDRPIRFDVIAVMLGRNLEIRSLEQIEEAF